MEQRGEKATTAAEMRKAMADNKVDMKEDKAGDTADNKVVVMAVKVIPFSQLFSYNL